MPAYTTQNAIDYCKPLVKNVPTVSALQDVAVDTAHTRVYTHRMWRWTLAALTAIPLVDGTQDYTIANNDFYRLKTARITRTDLTPDENIELDRVEFLAPDLTVHSFVNSRLIAYEPVSTKLRLEWATSVPTGVTAAINGEYQKNPTKLTVGSANLFMPDTYFHVFVEWLLYNLYRFSDDNRAGTVQVVNGRRVYTGQLGIAMDALNAMAEAEDLADGDPLIFPAEPLISRGYSRGLLL